MTNKDYDENKLLKSCTDGNTAAFEIIVHKYKSLVCAITYSAVGQVEKSEELAQQTFVNAWKNLKQLNDFNKFKAWLLSITRNVIRDSFKKQNRDIVSQAKSIDSLKEVEAKTPEPLNVIISREQQEIIRDSLQQIPEIYREPLVLFYRQQQSIREVAGSLEITEGIARTRLSRGRKMLREHLAEMVESGISQTAPKKAFTTAVIASVAGIAIKGSGVAAAADIATASSTTGTAASVAAVMSGTAVKVITAVAVILIGVAAVVTYKQFTRPNQTSTPIPAAIAGEKAEDAKPINEHDKAIEKATRQTTQMSTKAIDLPDVDAFDNPPVRTEEAKPPVISAQPDLAENDEYEFVPKGVLSGLITDIETAEPVTDAIVSIWISRIYTIETDENGFYSFDSINSKGNYKIKITSKEYTGIYDYDNMPVINLEKNKQAVKHFQLERACMIEVLVVDEAGDPIKDVRLLATSLADGRKREIGKGLHAHKTDDEGYILMGGFKPSETNYLITAMHEVERTVPGPDYLNKISGVRFVTMDSVHAPDKLFVKLNDPEVILYGEIVLRKGVKVRGYAEYADGIPADGLKISATPDWWHCMRGTGHHPVEPNGFFTLENIVPGDFNIHAHFENKNGDGGTSYAVMQSKLPIDGDGLLTVKIPKKSPGSLVSISGTIEFTGNKKPDRIEISAYSPNGSRGDVSLWKDTDSFTVGSLEPGLYRLSFSGSNIKRKVIKNVEAPSEGLAVELEYFEKPKIAGTVVDGLTGDAVTTFRARARKTQILHGNNYVQANQWNDFDNTEGKYEIQTVGPGVYQVQIAAEGYAWVWSEEINTDDNISVVIPLTAGGNIEGTVVDDMGKPVTGAKVAPLSKASGNMPRTNETFVSDDGAVETVKGDFLLENLAAGKETLRVMCNGYSPSIVKGIAVAEGRTTEDVQIVLTKGGTVEGYVYDPQGKAQSNIVLYFQDDSGYSGGGEREAGRLAIAITDPNGFYRVSGLPEKMCHVRFQDSSKYLGVIRRRVLPKNGKVSRLDFGGKPIVTGQLIVDDLPLEGRKVLLGSLSNPTFGHFKCLDRTSADGEFTFGGAPLGKFALYYEQADKRGKWIKVMVVEVKAEDIDLGVVPDKMARVIVTIENADAENNMQISQVVIQEGTGLLGRPIGVAKAPVSKGQPYVIDSVPPGKYTLSISRSDFFIIRKEIEIEKGATETKVLCVIPKSTASISGRIIGDSRAVSFWSSDEKLTGTIMAAGDGSFKVANLPAGKYLAGINMPMMKKVIAEFELSNGQEKKIELDTSELQTGNISILQVQIVDDNGVPFSSAEVWLAGDGKEIEPYMNLDSEIIFAAAAGDYTLHAVHPNYKDVSMEVKLEAQDLQTTRAKILPLFIRLEAK